MIPFSERDLKTLLDAGQITFGPVSIILHPQSTTAGFLKVIKARAEKEMKALIGEKVYVPELGDIEDPNAWVLASEQLAAEKDGQSQREEE